MIKNSKKKVEIKKGTLKKLTEKDLKSIVGAAECEPDICRL